MHLFAPERPLAAAGTQAILTDGSPIPHIVATPRGNGQIKVQVMLNTYDSNGGYSYRSVLLYPWEMEHFFRSYYDDPEKTFKIYFNWKPQEPTTVITKVEKTNTLLPAEALL